MESKPYNLEERLVDFTADSALFCKAMSNDFTGQYMGINYCGLQEVLHLILVKCKVLKQIEILEIKRLFL